MTSTRIIGWLLVTAMALGACAGSCDSEPARDPRLGEQGQVRLTGPGCSSSTMMAVGSRARMRVEPASNEQPLPTAFSVRSSEAATIELTSLASADAFELRALREGTTRIEVVSEGEVYDALSLRAEPVAFLSYESESIVVEGGAFHAIVTEVWGPCGDDECTLFGDGFLSWETTPMAALVLDRDADRTVTMRAGAPGAAMVRGIESGAGRALVDVSVEIVPVADVTGISATATVVGMDGQPLRSVSFPWAVVVGETIIVRLEALRSAGEGFPLSRSDTAWSMEGDTSAASMLDQNGAITAGEPWVAVFEAVAAGNVELIAHIEILGRDDRFALEVR